MNLFELLKTPYTRSLEHRISRRDARVRAMKEQARLDRERFEASYAKMRERAEAAEARAADRDHFAAEVDRSRAELDRAREDAAKLLDRLLERHHIVGLSPGAEERAKRDAERAPAPPPYESLAAASRRLADLEDKALLTFTADGRVVELATPSVSADAD